MERSIHLFKHLYRRYFLLEKGRQGPRRTGDTCFLHLPRRIPASVWRDPPSLPPRSPCQAAQDTCVLRGAMKRGCPGIRWPSSEVLAAGCALFRMPNREAGALAVLSGPACQALWAQGGHLRAPGAPAALGEKMVLPSSSSSSSSSPRPRHAFSSPRLASVFGADDQVRVLAALCWPRCGLESSSSEYRCIRPLGPRGADLWVPWLASSARVGQGPALRSSSRWAVAARAELVLASLSHLALAGPGSGPPSISPMALRRSLGPTACSLALSSCWGRAGQAWGKGPGCWDEWAHHSG